MNLKTLSLGLAMFFIASSSFAQSNKTGNWCATDYYHQQALNKLTPEQQAEGKSEVLNIFNNGRSNLNNNNKKKALIIIPCVVHVLSYNGDGNISKAQVLDGLRVLNEDFRRLNADTTDTRSIFKQIAADSEIEFRLANYDPQGNCTDGIVRHSTPLTNDANNACKATSYWPSNEYMNIWLVNSIASSGGGITLGYAQFPYTSGGGINSTYGLVVRHDQWGTIGTSSADGRTATHEIGHCLGLFHTFQSGCGSDCSASGDFVCDTPPASTNTFGCNTNQNTCSNDASGPDPYGTNVVDQIENYMSYDACQNMFTAEQKAVMHSALTSVNGLINLTSTNNLNATGTNNPYNPVTCVPIADFEYDKKMVCVGSSISFTDISWNGDPTSWNWTFNGGTPNSSSQQNPTITYNSAGEYDVTLQATNSAGSDTETKNDIVLVSSLTAQYSGSYTEGVENISTFNNDWIIDNPSGSRKWETTSSTSYSGNNCVRIVNYSGNPEGDFDHLITPSYDISSLGSPGFKFKYAFALKNSNNNDRLKVWVSTDCGTNWQLRFAKSGSTLATAPNHPSSFVPNGLSEWDEGLINLSAYAGSSNVRLRFEFEADGGNNIYLDDFNLFGWLNVEELNGVSNMVIYPNPSNGNSTIKFNLIKNINDLTISLKDITGKQVATIISNGSFNKGEYTLNIDQENKLAPGMYLIEFNADNIVTTERLMIK